MPKTSKHAGKQLAARRKAANVTQIALAKRLKLSQPSISVIERSSDVSPAVKKKYLAAVAARK